MLGLRIGKIFWSMVIGLLGPSDIFPLVILRCSTASPALPKPTPGYMHNLHVYVNKKSGDDYNNVCPIVQSKSLLFGSQGYFTPSDILVYP